MPLRQAPTRNFTWSMTALSAKSRNHYRSRKRLRYR
jgi:hypothetical protein